MAIRPGGGEQASLPLDANIRSVEFVFGPVVQSSSELEDGFVKARLAQAEGERRRRAPSEDRGKEVPQGRREEGLRGRALVFSDVKGAGGDDPTSECRQ